MQTLPRTFSASALQREYRKIINVANETRDAVVLINNSVPEAVILGVDTYNQLVSDDYAWDETFVLSQVGQADRSSKAGKSKRLKNWNDLDR